MKGPPGTRKQPGGKFSLDQERFISRVNTEGGPAFVGRIVEDVAEKLGGKGTMEAGFMTVREVVQYLGPAETTIYRLAENKDPSAVDQ